MAALAADLGVIRSLAAVARDPNARGTDQLVLWLFLLALVGGAWGLDRYSRGYNDWTHAAGLPWVSFFLCGVAALIFRSILSRAHVTPEVATVLQQAARDRATCRHCGHSLRGNSMTCGACGRVVNWPSIVGAGIGVLLVVAWILFAAFGR